MKQTTKLFVKYFFSPLSCNVVSYRRENQFCEKKHSSSCNLVDWKHVQRCFRGYQWSIAKWRKKLKVKCVAERRERERKERMQRHGSRWLHLQMAKIISESPCDWFSLHKRCVKNQKTKKMTAKKTAKKNHPQCWPLLTRQHSRAVTWAGVESIDD